MSTELFIITHKDTGEIWVADTGKWSWTNTGQQTAAWNRSHKRCFSYIDTGSWHKLGDPLCSYERTTIFLDRDVEEYEDWPEYYKDLGYE